MTLSLIDNVGLSNLDNNHNRDDLNTRKFDYIKTCVDIAI